MNRAIGRLLQHTPNTPRTSPHTQLNMPGTSQTSLPQRTHRLPTQQNAHKSNHGYVKASAQLLGGKNLKATGKVRRRIQVSRSRAEYGGCQHNTSHHMTGWPAAQATGPLTQAWRPCHTDGSGQCSQWYSTDTHTHARYVVIRHC